MMSQVRPKARPTPAAGPLIAAMKALSEFAISRDMPPNCSRIQRQISNEPPFPAGSARCSVARFIRRRSPPVENALPAPVRTIAFTSLSATSSAAAARVCTISAALSTFSLPGSLIVSTA